ncbi:hypothetical protein DFH06DRAFT_1352291 [Mycena polygramma]|nr:hypothetical protein DFH06DRAFT_1352291 [Mycena polygramma]
MASDGGQVMLLSFALPSSSDIEPKSPIVMYAHLASLFDVAVALLWLSIFGLCDLVRFVFRSITRFLCTIPAPQFPNKLLVLIFRHGVDAEDEDDYALWLPRDPQHQIHLHFNIPMARKFATVCQTWAYEARALRYHSVDGLEIVSIAVKHRSHIRKLVLCYIRASELGTRPRSR